MKALEHNIITATDSYKVGHWLMYPPGMSCMRSYLEARAGSRYPYTIFFGLQYFRDTYLEGEQVTKEKIAQAKEEWGHHLFDPTHRLFNEEGWEYIRTAHKGRLPIRIRAVKEGTVVPISNALMTVESTDPKCAWLTNYLETILTHVWYPTTVATRSHYLKSVILAALEKSGDPSTIQFKLHDFGYRGVTCAEQAALGGGAHLINFWGTDTFKGVAFLKQYYGPDFSGLGYPGYSIGATEHSTVTSWGRDGEIAAVGNLLEKFPDGLVACVGDSYDMINFVENIVGTVYRDKITGRNGTFIVRPDSGDPHTLLPQLLQILWEKFGGTINDKGYRVLPPVIRLIQGDGINDVTVGTILNAVMAAGFSADNLAFGSGGGLLQQVNRDTQRFAFKCCQVVINGVEYDVYKTPKTDLTKASKRGNLKLIKTSGYKTVRMEEPGEDLLIPVFDNGHAIGHQTLAEIRLAV